MAGLSLLTLLDDIASVLDDVALMTKVAAKKTAAVLGDDLALNAEKVSGVSADRELPVVWKVAKGSFKNKAILVPAALLISAIAPWLIAPLLLLGGLFLCFEGAEKILHAGHEHHDQAAPVSVADTASDDHNSDAHPLSLTEFEDEKVKGAIRTDFILSAEIIVIALGTVQHQAISSQIIVVSLIAICMTIGVYGLVAGIVKLDDAGLYLVTRSKAPGLQRSFGNTLLAFAPRLMKSLTVIGTIAMFLVGGNIVTHSIPGATALLTQWQHSLPALIQDHSILNGLFPLLGHAVIGLVAGIIVFAIVTALQKMRAKLR